MRDFRDAKAMARSLRDALATKTVQTTHSESLELIAKAFGYESSRTAAYRQIVALRENASAADDAIFLSPGFAQLKNRTSEELRAMQKFSQDQLKRYEQALRTTTAIVVERTR